MFLVPLFILSMTVVLFAEKDETELHGDFLFGYRMVNLKGTDFKYKEDINLDDGFRLFNFNLSYTPTGKLNSLFDRLDINVYNYGGDPFESFNLSVQKYGKYQFKYDRRKAAYFYNDLHDVGGGHLYDYHTFDFNRVMDSGLVKIWLGSIAQVYFNFDRYSKKGESITTFDFNRIEFEFDKPIDEDYKSATIGVDLNLKWFSLSIEEKIQDFSNTNTLFLPGYADGGSAARYPSAFYYFDLSQPYNLDTATTTLKFSARPFSSLIMKGAYSTSKQNMDLEYSESSSGLDYLGYGFNYSHTGEGSFERNIQLVDFDVTYMVFKKLAVVGAFRYNTFDQEGDLTIDGTQTDTAVVYETIAAEGGLQFQISPDFALTAGYRFERRDLEDLETITYEFETVRNGFFGNLRWDLSKNIKLTADYQHGNTNDPYTYISPTDFTRFRTTLRARFDQFSISTVYLWNKTFNDVYSNNWESVRNQFNLRAGYHTKKIKVFAGYSLIDVMSQADKTIAYPPSWSGAGSFLWEIMYEGKSNLLDGSAYFHFSDNWSLGAYFNSYSNKGFWEIQRTTFKGFLEHVFENGLVGQIAYRYVDFKEEESGFNDYTANIVEISFGYRWK